MLSNSTGAIPPGHCGIHGYHGRTSCPKCSTSTLPFTPLIQSPPAPVSAAVSPARAKPGKVPCPECGGMEPNPDCDVCAAVSPAEPPERVQLTTHKVVIDANGPEHAERIAAGLRNDGYRAHTEVHRMIERGGKITIERSRS